MDDKRNLEGEYFVPHKYSGDIFFYHHCEMSLKLWFSDIYVTLIWKNVNKKLQYINGTI